MSLVSAYVRLSDGLWYRDPVLKLPRDEEGFICFDDDEPPEFVTFNILLGYHGIGQILAEMGIRCKLRSGTMACQRQPLNSKRFKEAATWWILDPTVGTCVHPNWVHEHRGTPDGKIVGEGVFYDWGTP